MRFPPKIVCPPLRPNPSKLLSIHRPTRRSERDERRKPTSLSLSLYTRRKDCGGGSAWTARPAESDSIFSSQPSLDSNADYVSAAAVRLSLCVFGCGPSCTVQLQFLSFSLSLSLTRAVRYFLELAECTRSLSSTTTRTGTRRRRRRSPPWSIPTGKRTTRE